MKRIMLCLVLAAAVAGALAGGMPPAGMTHLMVSAATLAWGDPPAVLPRGARFVVVSGDPSQPGPFTLRLRMPAGYQIAPHWHPTDEHVTVLAGTFSMGMGERLDRAAARELRAGDYALMPAGERHYAFTKHGATVQVHGIGPFALTYVNPADDPSRAAPR